MISGSRDKTVRQWDLKEGKEIEELRDVCKEEVQAVAVSSDSRWVVTGGGNWEDADSVELKVCEVETGIVKNLPGHSDTISCIDISADNTLLASGSDDRTARIWNLETGKLVAGPFGSDHDRWVGSVRFSTDSKKLAVELLGGKCLEVWDIQSQKLYKRIGNGSVGYPSVPIFWTNKNKNILAAFSFTWSDEEGAETIYEFDASTLETVGTPFEGHTKYIVGLALSFDATFLASASYDETIKLWAFESRQLLASFDVQYPSNLILSPDSCKLAYVTCTSVLSNVRLAGYKDHRICICDTPPDILAQARVRNLANVHFLCANIPLQTIARKKRIQSDLLNVRVSSFTHHILTHLDHCSLMQLVLLLGTADRQYMPYQWCRDLRLQYTHSNPCSFA
jgi:WD40 repeat protein